jgi:hypothetical protein
MKKIILGIITIILAVTIFGCGRVQQSSGGGSSGGNSGGNTYSISGKASVPESVDTGDGGGSQAQGFSIMAVSDKKPLSGADVKIYEFGKLETIRTVGQTQADGSYSVSGLDPSKTYVVSVEKNTGAATINMQNIAYRADTQVDIEPLSTLAVATLEALAAATSSIRKTIQEAKNTDYIASYLRHSLEIVSNNCADLNKLAGAATNNEVIENVVSGVKDEVKNALPKFVILNVNQETSGARLTSDPPRQETTTMSVWMRDNSWGDFPTEDDRWRWFDLEGWVYNYGDEVTLTYEPVAYVDEDDGPQPAPSINKTVEVGVPYFTQPFEPRPGFTEYPNTPNEKQQESHIYNLIEQPKVYITGEAGKNTLRFTMDKNYMITTFSLYNK